MKNAKIADFGPFENPWSLNENFDGYPVCGKMSGMWSVSSDSSRWGCSTCTDAYIDSPHIVHTPPNIHFLYIENVCYFYQYFVIVYYKKEEHTTGLSNNASNGLPTPIITPCIYNRENLSFYFRSTNKRRKRKSWKVL